MAGTFQNPLMSSMATELPSSEYDPFGIDQILHEDESSTPTPTPLHLKAISLVLKFELDELRLCRGYLQIHPSTSGYLLTSSPQGVTWYKNPIYFSLVILFDFTQYTGVPYHMSCEKLIEYRLLCSRAGVSPNTDLASFEADHEETMWRSQTDFSKWKAVT